MQSSFLHIKLFFYILSSELETVSVFPSSLFVLLLFMIILVKQKASFSSYPLAKICMFSLNKALSSISSMLIISKFFAFDNLYIFYNIYHIFFNITLFFTNSLYDLLLSATSLGWILYISSILYLNFFFFSL